ncbi:(d)CMP kinase [uncultured Endozoicomonas sp.]|uniref:(d)CMP kinase n=1 Tax=uncultured Endozoicomonas sp. TaxID=432652 RepID=UPI002617E39C|nr:(d)CMP kinase [uncultured Endozoicomonas sp.]
MSESQTSVAVVTIDGPSGSGKGTIAALLARELGWGLLDSGALYRLTALAALNHGVDFSDESSLEVLAGHLDVQFLPSERDGLVIVLEGEQVGASLRTEDVGAMASKVAALPGVRRALLQRQRDFAEAPGLVADGRDMGTVVFPDAVLKVFLTASAEERAKRRFEQLQQKGIDASFDRLLDDITARDERDSQRTVAPLKPADDAIVLDSTRMSIHEVFNEILKQMRLKGLL